MTIIWNYRCKHTTSNVLPAVLPNWWQFWGSKSVHIIDGASSNKGQGTSLEEDRGDVVWVPWLRDVDGLWEASPPATGDEPEFPKNDLRLPKIVEIPIDTENQVFGR